MGALHDHAVAVARQAMDRLVIDVPDYPEAGVVFKDITPLLADHTGLEAAVQALAAAGRDDDGTVTVTKVVGTEARGFILAAPVALALGVGFVPVRKPGKLPRECHSEDYSLEYGTNTLQLHVDALGADDHVLLVDDVLATGGTLAATRRLVESCGATVSGASVLMELAFLDGRALLDGLECSAVQVL